MTHASNRPAYAIVALYLALGVGTYSALGPMPATPTVVEPIGDPVAYFPPVVTTADATLDPWSYRSDAPGPLRLPESAYDAAPVLPPLHAEVAEPPFRNTPLARPDDEDEDGVVQLSSAQIAAIDYGDPVAGGMVPLQRVRGRENVRLAGGFRVRDFATRDGAPYARISNDLVRGLARVRRRTGSVIVISGYRHRTYNARREVGGVPGSYHIAGLAADVWSSTRTPLQLAAAVLREFGPSVGIGLGRSSIHVDLRGRLASWTYQGAAMSEPEFDVWVRRQVGARIPGHMLAAAEEARRARSAQPPIPRPAQRPAVDTTLRRMAARPPGTVGPQTDEPLRAAPPTIGQAPDPSTSLPPAESVPSVNLLDANAVLGRYRSAMAAYARSQGGPGAVVLDLRNGSPSPGNPSASFRFAAPGSPQAQQYGLDNLITQAVPGRTFAYLIITPPGTQAAGLSGM